jgi:hypothetical protein
MQRVDTSGEKPRGPSGYVTNPLAI